MAGCYHNNQVFKSDLKIEVAREGDILEIGQDLKDLKCDKNPGHRDFIPFKDLTMEHLPFEYRNRITFDGIKKMGNLVVRLVLLKIKNGRCMREVGSGCMIKIEDEYFIQTNSHVVKTDDEVKRCTVEFHYDNDSKSSVLTGKGVRLVVTCAYRDFTLFTFHPIDPIPDILHQLDSEDNDDLDQPFIVIMYKNNNIETMKTYPDPRCTTYSHLSFYLHLNLNNYEIQLMFISYPNGSYSFLKSLYFKFQPVPSNIQEITSITIHIDEEGGNRVIPGDVVKFGDEFVVKLSESIFQDEVQKCKLVWNGEVIGCGTRLYFEQVQSRELFSGIDLEEKIEQGIEYFWIFDIYPIPKGIDDILQSGFKKYVCCIGHPHGAIKMVTFGRLLDESVERFDDRYRRIIDPNHDCQCKEVTCMKYTCKTCPGSSGSPVCVLYKGLDCNADFAHFMGEKVEGFLPDGERIENINMAWTAL